MPRSAAPTFLASVVPSLLPSPIAVKTSNSIVFNGAVSWYAFSEIQNAFRCRAGLFLYRARHLIENFEPGTLNLEL